MPGSSSVAMSRSRPPQRGPASTSIPKARLERENVHRQEEIRKEHHVVEMVGGSRTLLAARRKVETVAPIDSTVLISDETRRVMPRRSRSGC